MAKSNRKCVICGNEYYYCTHGCTDSLGKPSWMAAFCSDNCRNVYNVVTRYNMKKITAEEARKFLDAYDLSDKEHFVAYVQKLIDEIFEVTKFEEVVVDADGSNNEDFVSMENLITMMASIPENNSQNADAEAAVLTLNEAVKQTNKKKKKKKRKND